MAIKDTILSWFFGKPQKTEEAPSEEEQIQTPPPPSKPEPIQLVLPPEHALNQLWRLQRRQTGRVGSPPQILLEAPEGRPPVMPPAEAQRELVRLQMTVNSTANQRLNQALPKAKRPDEPPPPSPDLDALVVVFVTTNRQSAWLLIYPPVGKGRNVDRAMLSQALEESKVCFGLDEALLDRLPQAPNRYFHLVLAAQGTQAVNGKHGYIVDLFPRVAERKVTMDEYGRVDYTSLNLVQNVEEGAVICRAIAPTQGIPGRTVLGQELPAKDGRAAVLPKGRNTEISEDGSRLVASRAGCVEFTGRGFQVKPLLEIGGSVDYSTGSINFLGDVHIHGDVCSGFSVRAMGNITVDGVVEACTVDAGEDLVVVKGIQGDDRAVIRANRGIYAKFLESSCVYAKELIQADCIINCDVYSDGTIQVCSGRGTIIGGSLRAAGEVNASIVGSRSECATMISLGGHPCESFDQDILQREIQELEEEIKKTEPQPDSPSKLTRMSKMRMQLSVNRNKLEQLAKEEGEPASPLQEEQQVRRLVCGIAYPGTQILIGEASMRLKHEVRPCTAVLVSGEICLI